MIAIMSSSVGLWQAGCKGDHYDPYRPHSRARPDLGKRRVGLASRSADVQPLCRRAGRAIKALSAKELEELVQGRGMGLARAAELNRYPGPMHSLEMAGRLKLSQQQQEALKLVMAKMSDNARALGAELLSLERELDGAFAARTINAERLSMLTTLIGARHGALRAVHLEAHLKTEALLSADQIESYDILRGYADRSAAGAHDAKH
ncbi:MAG: hypothetical protein Q8S58_16195 [Bosea sp. (in: a-proteobacteria)]|nr:hypothetical protein [Bosea sp. (in: a-proteobacteria)]